MKFEIIKTYVFLVLYVFQNGHTFVNRIAQNLESNISLVIQQ